MPEKSPTCIPTLMELDTMFFCAFTNGICNISDTLCLKKGGSMPKKMLMLSGRQRYLGGLLCTNKLQKKLHVL